MRSVLSVHLFLGPTCSLYPASRLVVLVDVVIVVVSYFHFFFLLGVFLFSISWKEFQEHRKLPREFYAENVWRLRGT